MSNSKAYRFALREQIFPVLDIDVEEWPDDLSQYGGSDLIYIEWRINPRTMSSLYRQLAAAEKNDKSSFYQFERGLWSSTSTTRITRDQILDAFRYFFMKGVFPESFWRRFCRRGEAPMEALYVICGKTALEARGVRML